MKTVMLWLISGIFFFTSSLGSAAVETQLLSSTELSLPSFQATKLEEDAASEQFLFDHEQNLWILGKTSVWVWDLEAKKLKRLRLHDGTVDGSILVTLSTDGLSLFASSRATVYQINARENRIFRYRASPKRGVSNPFFIGQGEEFWWFADGQIFKLDRYGKTIYPIADTVTLEKQQGFAYLAGKRQLYWADRSSLLRLRLDRPKEISRIFTTKHPILDVHVINHHLVIHTKHTILRLTTEGNVLQAIPVEGRRNLARMHLNPEQHAYLFDDQLLEIYDVKTQQTLRYALPLEEEQSIRQIRLSWPLIAVASDNQIRVFHLQTPPEVRATNAELQHEHQSS